MHQITPVILIGGLGTRLQPVVKDRPKGIAEVGGKPFIYYLLKQLEIHNFKTVLLCTGYMSSAIEESLSLLTSQVKIEYSKESTPLGTAGALRNALPKISTDNLMVMNGDSFCDIDMHELLLKSSISKADCMMTLTKVKNSCRYGSVHINDQGFVTKFSSRPEESGENIINAGIYIFRKSLIESIPPKTHRSLENDFLPKWSEEGRIAYFIHNGRFIDIGTPNSYIESQSFFGTQNS